MKAFLKPLSVVGGLTAAFPALACSERDPGDASRTVDAVEVAHKDIAPISKKVMFDLERGLVTTQDRSGASSVPGIKLRCMAAPAYAFEIATRDWNAAQKKGAISVSLDPNYTTAPDAKRVCMAVKAKDLSAKPLADGVTELSVTIQEDYVQRAQRQKLIAIQNPDRNREAWCLSFSVK